MAQTDPQAAGSGRSTTATDRRLGRIRISDQLLRASIGTGEAAALFAGSVPLDVQRDWIGETSDFILWHPAFDVTPEGFIIPYYRAIFTLDEHGGATVAFKNDGISPHWADSGITIDQIRKAINAEGGAA